MFQNEDDIGHIELSLVLAAYSNLFEQIIEIDAVDFIRQEKDETILVEGAIQPRDEGTVERLQDLLLSNECVL